MQTYHGQACSWRASADAFDCGSYGAVMRVSPAGPTEMPALMDASWGDGTVGAKGRFALKRPRTTRGLARDPCTDGERMHRKRLVRLEIEVLQRVKHAHIIALVDHARDPVHPFYVMPRYEHTLFTLAAEYGALPGLVRPAAQQLYDALAHLHAAGLAHCDVSPQNVLVSRTDFRRDVHVILCDFGSARCAQHTGALGEWRRAVQWALVRGVSHECMTWVWSAAPECWVSEQCENIVPNTLCDVWAAAFTALSVSGMLGPELTACQVENPHLECDVIKRARAWGWEYDPQDLAVFRRIHPHLPGERGGELALLLASRVFVDWYRRARAEQLAEWLRQGLPADL